MSDIEIRPTVLADIEQLAKVLVQVHESDGYPVEGVQDPRAWLHINAPIGRWTALLDEKPVGHIALSVPDATCGAAKLLAREVAMSPHRVAELGRLFVSPEIRGLGVAQSLMHMAEARATRLGFCIVLDVMLKDVAAIGLYESRGWKSLGPFEHTFGRGQSEKALAMIYATPAFCAKGM